MRRNDFVRRRLRQLVRDELERTDLRALVQEVVLEVIRELHEESCGQAEQRRAINEMKLKVVR